MLMAEGTVSKSSVLSLVYPVGANPEYESQYDSASVCLNESRHKFNEFSQFLQTLASELGVEASEQADLPDILSIPSLNIEFDMRKVDELPLLREENRMKFLAALRNVYRRSPSVSSIHTDLSTIHMHLKEGNDLVVSFSLNDEYAHSIQSATLEPSYPCFQNAIEYAISRNDVGLLVYQAISGLYASQRLHLEMERLQEKAVVTSEDDRSVEIVFPEEVEMTCMIPALYPNVEMERGVENRRLD